MADTPVREPTPRVKMPAREPTPKAVMPPREKTGGLVSGQVDRMMPRTSPASSRKVSR